MKLFEINHELGDYVVRCDSVLIEGNIAMFLDNMGKIVYAVSGNFVIKQSD